MKLTSGKILRFVILVLAAKGTVAATVPGGLTNQQLTFVQWLNPLVEKVNTELLDQRRAIFLLRENIMAGKDLSPRQKILLNKYLKFYDIQQQAGSNDYNYDIHELSQLLSRLDVIPPKIVLACAALNSEWGRRKQLMLQNAFFCIPDSSRVEMNAKIPGNCRVYQHALDAVRGFAGLLNRAQEFEKFRDLRATVRFGGAPPSLTLLISSLMGGLSASGIEEVELYKTLDILEDVF